MQGFASPSALLLLWIAHIRMSLEMVCDTSARMWKTLNADMVRRYGYTARGREPGAGVAARVRETCSGLQQAGWMTSVNDSSGVRPSR